MIINVTQLTIKADNKFVSFHPVNEEMVASRKEEAARLQKKYPGRFTNDKPSPRWLVLHNGSEVEHAIACLEGRAEFYPYFDDGIHQHHLGPFGHSILLF